MIGQRGVVKLFVVVLGAIEELSERRVHLVIVLGVLDVEVGDPAELAVNISLLGQLGVVGHARSLHFVLFVGIQLALRVQQDSLLVLEVFVEVLLHETD